MTPLPFHSSRSALIALLAGAALACASVNPVPTPTPAQAPATQPPYAAYVLLVEAPDHTPIPFARVIVASGQPCPALSGGPTSLAMTRRDNPHGFTVDVCEAVVVLVAWHAPSSDTEPPGDISAHVWFFDAKTSSALEELKPAKGVVASSDRSTGTVTLKLETGQQVQLPSSGQFCDRISHTVSRSSTRTWVLQTCTVLD